MIYLERKSEAMLKLELIYNCNISDLLRMLYVDFNHDKQEIANQLNINRDTVSDWLDKCGVYSHRLEMKK